MHLLGLISYRITIYGVIQMNNKSIIPFYEIDQDNIIYPSSDEVEVLEYYLNQKDKFDTLIKSFHIADFNFHQLFYHFTIYSDDTLKREEGLPSDDFVVINALIINYLSTSKMFVDIVENFDSSLYETFHSYVSSKFDSSFYYQLMTILRNFSLHGHLPVYLHDNRYSFNLNYILEEGKRFNFNKTSKRKIEEITRRIFEEYQDIANISLLRTVVEYHKVILEIFVHFFTVNYYNFLKVYNNFQKIIKRYDHKKRNDSVCVALDDTLHIVKSTDSVNKLFRVEQFKAKKHLETHINNFKQIINSNGQ